MGNQITRMGHLARQGYTNGMLPLSRSVETKQGEHVSSYI